MRTVVVGSREWCDHWARFYWDRACKWTDRLEKYGPNESYELLAMEDMFMSYMWADTEPWA